MNPALVFIGSSTLVHLSPVDLVIIVFYFALVLAIGVYLRGRANTSEDFFLAGRDRTWFRMRQIGHRWLPPLEPAFMHVECTRGSHAFSSMNVKSVWLKNLALGRGS